MNFKKLLPVRWYMKLAWERRARRNAMHYVADFKGEWTDKDQFFQSGLHDVERFFEGTEWGDASGRRLLEIGCGLGRMTRHLAARFAGVDGVDISPTMIRQARELNREVRNATFQVGNGTDLSMFADKSFDDAISYIVFQHIPDADVVYGYIGEALRVLKPGGRFRFQARNDHSHAKTDTYNGASIDVAEVKKIAEENGFRLVKVTGEGTQYCYFDLQG